MNPSDKETEDRFCIICGNELLQKTPVQRDLFGRPICIDCAKPRQYEEELES